MKVRARDSSGSPVEAFLRGVRDGFEAGATSTNDIVYVGAREKISFPCSGVPVDVM